MERLSQPVPPRAPDLAESAPGGNVAREPRLPHWLPLATFLTYLAAVGLYILFDLGRSMSFFADDWAFIVAPPEYGGLFVDHDGHWVTIPFLVYRGLFALFGVTTYLPYLAVAVMAHLGVAVLLRVVMRKSGVGAWSATVFAASIASFGLHGTNYLWAFQITLTLAVVFGLAQLLLGDHAAAGRLRQALAVAGGVAAVMCSGAGLVMVLGASTAIWLSRGWRRAAPQLLIPLLGYAAYRWASAAPNVAEPDAVSNLAGWFVEAFTAGIGVLFLNPPLTFLVATAGVLGLWIATLETSWLTVVRDRAAAPIGLAIAALAMIGLTWLARGGMLGTEVAGAEKYAYVESALILPLIAFGVHEILKRSSMVGIAIVALVAITNLLSLIRLTPAPLPIAHSQHVRDVFVAVANDPLATVVPATATPDTGPFLYTDNVTVAWLLAANEAGKLPAASDPDPQLQAEVFHRLALQERDPVGVTETDCRPIAPGEQIRMDPKAGDMLAFTAGSDSAAPAVTVATTRDQTPFARKFSSPSAATDIGLDVHLDGVEITVTNDGDGLVRACRGAA